MTLSLFVRKIFTLFFWFHGLNDPLVAMNKTKEKYSYIKKFRNGKKWTLIDCGSHKGEFADRVNKVLNVTKIVFVDPNDQYNNILREKYPDSLILNYAVAVDSIDLSYFRNIKNPGQNFTSATEMSEEKVQSIPLEKIVDLIGFENSEAILKIDIEGDEVAVLRSVPIEMLNKMRFISIEITPISNSIDFFILLNDFIPDHFDFYRERRYGWIRVNRLNPHWTDYLNLFQNLILVNRLSPQKNI